MPITKLSNGHSSAAMLRYLDKQNGEGTRVRAHGGNVLAASWKDAEREFEITRKQFNESAGIQYHHASISFAPDDLGSLAGPDGKPDYQQLVAFGEEWAQGAGIAEGHQYFVVAHGDKTHPHVHVAWSALDQADGKRWHSDRAFLERARDTTDALARERGIRHEPSRDRNTAKPPDAVLRAAARGAKSYSWKVDLKDRIAEAARISISEEDFKKNLSQSGVDLRKRGEAYTYSFMDDAGFKRVARASRLGEEYRPKPLSEGFDGLRKGLASDPQAAARFAQQLRTQKGMPLTSWRQDLRRHINAARGRSTGFEEYRDTLQRRGIEVSQSTKGLTYTVIDSGGERRTITARELGAAHSEARLRQRLEDNAFRRHARLEIITAYRGARSEKDFVQRLADRGVSVEKDPAGRFVYHFRLSGDSTRKVTGESLAPYLRTERIEARLEFRASNRPLMPAHSIISGSTRHAGGLAKTLSAEITRDSHPGYHQAQEPSYPDKRKRRLEREGERSRF